MKTKVGNIVCKDINGNEVIVYEYHNTVNEHNKWNVLKEFTLPNGIKVTQKDDKIFETEDGKLLIRKLG